MPSGYKRQHLRIDHFVDLKPYRRPNRAVLSRAPGRETDRHAEQLKRELAAAWATTVGLVESRDGTIMGVPGRYLDFETLPNQPLPNISWTSKGIRLASASRSSEGAAQGTIFVPDDAQGFMTTKLDEYQSLRGQKGRPAHQDR